MYLVLSLFLLSKCGCFIYLNMDTIPMPRIFKHSRLTHALEKALNSCTQSATVALERIKHCPFPDVTAHSTNP